MRKIYFILGSFLFSLMGIAQCPTVAPTAIDGCNISSGSVQIGASGGSTGYYSWYDNASGGNYLGSGTPFNTPSISSTTTYYVAAADINNALDFDGTDDYVQLGNPPQLQITGDLTIEMWLKPDNFSSRKNPYAKAYGGEGTITQETNGSLSFYYGTNGGNSTPYQGFNSGPILNSGQWSHIAIVRDLTNMKLYWYINGVLVNQATANYAAATAGGNNVTIGAGYVSNYDGQIDELRVWNTAKSQAQIQNEMNSCLTGSEANLVAYYDFEDNSGTTLTDKTASANNGTLTNMDPSTDWITANYDFFCSSCESSRTAVTATISGGTPVNLGNDTILTCTSLLTLDAGSGYSNYLWSTGATTQTINVSSSAIYWVQVDNGSGCYDYDTISVTTPSGSLNTLDFDGTDDYVQLGNPPQLQITGDLTIEMWLKPDNFSSRKNPYAKAYGGEGTITQETNGSLSFYYGTNGGNSTPYQGFNSGPILNSGEWNHIAIVRDLTNMQLYWYVNGMLVNQATANYAAATAGGNNVTIGSGYVSNYDGQIDELRVWNTARTQTQIRNKMCSKVKNSLGLVAYYSFDEGTGTSIKDKSSSALSGTLYNGPTWQVSGASIGDSSVYLYPGSWAGQSLTHFYCSGENLTVSNMSGTPDGVHIYSVGTVPNDVTGIVGLGANDRYFGVHKVNDASATYTATYDYTGNPYVNSASEPTLALYKRSDNASSPWSNTSATLNTTANTLTATAQGTEFILGTNTSGVNLPIELVSFEAKVNENKVDISWVTASEVNNDYFTVERSIDGKNWEEKVVTQGAGNSSETIKYHETDYNPFIDVSYYRLKQTDFDGHYSYSQKIAVNINQSTADVVIYPNPTNNQITIQSNINELSRIKIYNSLGQDVTNMTQQLSKTDNSLVIDLSQLTNGVYIVKTLTSANNVYKK